MEEHINVWFNWIFLLYFFFQLESVGVHTINQQSSAVVRINIRKQESKKKRKKTCSRPRNWPRKRESSFFFSWSRACFLSFFLDHYRFSWSLCWSRACFLSYFLDRFLGRKRVFLFSYSLVFFFWGMRSVIKMLSIK